MSRALGVILVAFAMGSAILAQPAASPTPRDALKGLGDLIGTWRGTGTTAAPPGGGKSDFWTETIAWEWQFKGDDACLKVVFEKSKNFTGGELRYLPDKQEYALTLRTPAKETLTFTGPLKERVLTLQREQDGEMQRLVFTFLHEGERYLYRYDVKPAAKALFVKK